MDADHLQDPLAPEFIRIGPLLFEVDGANAWLMSRGRWEALKASELPGNTRVLLAVLSRFPNQSVAYGDKCENGSLRGFSDGRPSIVGASGAQKAPSTLRREVSELRKSLGALFPDGAVRLAEAAEAGVEQVRLLMNEERRCLTRADVQALMHGTEDDVATRARNPLEPQTAKQPEPIRSESVGYACVAGAREARGEPRRETINASLARDVLTLLAAVRYGLESLNHRRVRAIGGALWLLSLLLLCGLVSIVRPNTAAEREARAVQVATKIASHLERLPHDNSSSGLEPAEARCLRLRKRHHIAQRAFFDVMDDVGGVWSFNPIGSRGLCWTADGMHTSLCREMLVACHPEWQALPRDEAYALLDAAPSIMNQARE